MSEEQYKIEKKNLMTELKTVTMHLQLQKNDMDLEYQRQQLLKQIKQLELTYQSQKKERGR